MYYILIKNPQFYSNLADILTILPTHGLMILTKCDGDWTKIVDFLLVEYFWASIIFFESVFRSNAIETASCTAKPIRPESGQFG